VPEVNSEAKAIIETVERLNLAEFVELGGDNKAVILPKGKELHSLKKLRDEYLTAPERKKGTAFICEPGSFVEHVNRMQDEHSVLFACVDRDKPSVTAVYDYHQKDGAPRFGQHRAHYPFPLSDEWKAWMGRNGSENSMSQEDFAEFIEDRMMDLAQPSLAGARTLAYVEAIQCELATPSQVATLSRELSIRVDQNLVQQVKVSSGESQMVFREEHRDTNGAPLKVPGAFLIQIPIFTGGIEAVLPVRLRFRVAGRSVNWHYEIALVDALFKQAIDEEIKKIQAGVELPVFVGSPEC
jgi:uncharacterized protein YfdQ (DUF2303 family)